MNALSRSARRLRLGVLTLSTLASSLPACRNQDAPAVVVRTGDLTLEAALRPDPPRQQDNTLELTVKDAQGQPLDGAEVNVEANMAAMGAMPAMRSGAEVKAMGAGRYRAEVDVPMAGTWSLDVSVRSPAGAGDARYSFTTGSRGLQTMGADTTGGAAQHQGHVETGTITVDPLRRQTIGVRTGPVVRRRVEVEVRAVGKVVYDETKLTDVSVKYPGWIGELRVDSPGQAVRRGQTLFTLYSPDLYATQEEFLAALRSQETARATGAPDRADYLVEATRQRLRFWDLSDRQIDEIARGGKPSKYLPIPSPVSGHVIEKNIVAGAAVELGMKLYRIAGLDRVWVEAEVYEPDLPLVSVGQDAVVTLPNLPGRTLTGKVAFVYPFLEAGTRTGRVRVELPNPKGELRPEMYAEVMLRADRGLRLVVPESAVLFAGQRRLVFLDRGDGHLEPRTIEVGVKSGEDFEVLSGLEEGDVVVTSGTFLVAAESRLRSATGQWQ